MKKILIFYASYGGGHLSAAKSIKQYLIENYSDFEIEMIDCMKVVNKAVEKITTGAYREMAKKIPRLWGRVYSNSQKGPLSKISKDSNKLMARRLYRVIQESNPNYIISTHPFSSQMVSYLKKKDKLHCVLATIMTDFAIHKQWLIGHEYTEYFFVSNESMKQDMIHFGIEANKIYVTGIPMSSKFLVEFHKPDIYQMFHLDANKNTVLFFGGGEFGLGKDRTIQILKALIQKLPNDQIVAVSGKNEKMKDAFEQLVANAHAQDRVCILGFTDKVPELMKIACAVVTKPGGLTTTESLASELPMIIINPIPRTRRRKCKIFRRKWSWCVVKK